MISKETIKEVVLSQKKVLDSLELGVIREKGFNIESFALAITGIRRCGKSTFLNQMLNKQKISYYLNLEDPRLDGFELSDFNKVEIIMREIYGGRGVYFFDEIQSIERWEKFIRYLIDKKEMVVITGSNAALLSKELGAKLTGRHLQVEMFPFSFREFISFTGKKPSLELFDNYLYKGGFPEFLKKENPEILHELLYDIAAKDIAARFGIRNITMLHKILIYLVSNVGKEFSYNSIKNMFSIKSVQSVIDYVFYFENAYLIFTIPRFSYSYKQQLVSPKKVYSIDNGFSYCNSVSFSKDKGKMLENVVFLGLRRKFKDIFYFREIHECDFLIKDKDKIVQAIQVCFDLNDENRDREINGLLSCLKEFNLREGFILTYNQKDEFLVESRKITVKPVWEWLLED